MRTDPVFYELFQTAPQTFFELLQITPLCPYRFESITVKTTEKRIDGVLKPTQADAPIYFAEVQASSDKAMYWRTAREVATYFEARPTIKNEWQAVVIWLNQEHDPGYGTTHINDKDGQARIRAVYLIDLLEKLPDNSLVLNILRPLIVDNEQEVRQNILTWVERIRATPNLSPETEQRLLMVMAQLIEEKFKILSYKELCKMLKLTPFKETESYKEAFQEDLQSYTLDKLIKQIKRKFKFAESTMNRLGARLRQLTFKDLEDLFESIFDLTTLRELNAWINARLPPDQPQPQEATPM